MANNKDDLAKKLGNNIKIFRKKLKLTQLELSIQADIAEDYLQSIEAVSYTHLTLPTNCT